MFICVFCPRCCRNVSRKPVPPPTYCGGTARKRLLKSDFTVRCPLMTQSGGERERELNFSNKIFSRKFLGEKRTGERNSEEVNVFVKYICNLMGEGRGK